MVGKKSKQWLPLWVGKKMGRDVRELSIMIEMFSAS